MKPRRNIIPLQKGEHILVVNQAEMLEEIAKLCKIELRITEMTGNRVGKGAYNHFLINHLIKEDFEELDNIPCIIAIAVEVDINDTFGARDIMKMTSRKIDIGRLITLTVINYLIEDDIIRNFYYILTDD